MAGAFEGLEKRWARHRETAEFFWAELAKLGLKHRAFLLMDDTSPPQASK